VLHERHRKHSCVKPAPIERKDPTRQPKPTGPIRPRLGSCSLLILDRRRLRLLAHDAQIRLRPVSTNERGQGRATAAHLPIMRTRGSVTTMPHRLCPATILAAAGGNGRCGEDLEEAAVVARCGPTAAAWERRGAGEWHFGVTKQHILVLFKPSERACAPMCGFGN
jgi:hypothetical protein